MAAIAAILILISFIAFWGGLAWLIISLLRKGSIRRGLGLILLGIILLPIGAILAISSRGSDPDESSKDIILGTDRLNPVPLYSSVVHSKIEITVMEVTRGWDAGTVGGLFASVPDDNHEWIAVRLRLRSLVAKDETDRYSPTEFRITGSRGIIYDEIFTPDTDLPLKSGEFFGGGEIIGDVVQQVHKEDGQLVLIYSPIFEGSRYLSLEP